MARLNPIAGTAAVLVLQLLTSGLVLAAVELPAVSAQEGPAQMPWLAQQGPDKSASDKDDC